MPVQPAAKQMRTQDDKKVEMVLEKPTVESVAQDARRHQDVVNADVTARQGEGMGNLSVTPYPTPGFIPMVKQLMSAKTNKASNERADLPTRLMKHKDMQFFTKVCVSVCIAQLCVV